MYYKTPTLAVHKFDAADVIITSETNLDMAKKDVQTAIANAGENAKSKVMVVRFTN